MHGGMAEGVHTCQVTENVLVRGQGRDGRDLLEDCPNKEKGVSEVRGSRSMHQEVEDEEGGKGQI